MSLKLLLRQYSQNAAAIVTLPAYMLRMLDGGPALVRRLEWVCDSVIELESFAGEHPHNS